MKDEEITINDALHFYCDLALDEGVVIDTDVGFFESDGTPVFPDMDMAKSMMNHIGNQIMRGILAEEGIDAQEVMQFFESVLFIRMTHDEEFTPDSVTLTAPHDLSEESEELRNSRRNNHLYECVRNTLLISDPSCVFTTGNSKAFGVNHSKLNPILAKYVESMNIRMGDDCSIEQREFVNDDVAQEYLDSVCDSDDIDPDSDDNNDDPFGMFV